MTPKRTTLTLMCGLPRSGKSTWLRKNRGEDIVVCLDVIRKEIFGHQFHGPAEQFVMGIAKSMVRLLLKQKKSVIIDATNIRRGWRAEWRTLAEECGARTRIVFIDAPLEVCLERNRTSKVGERLPVRKLREMAAGFADPIVSQDRDSKGRLIEVVHVRD